MSGFFIFACMISVREANLSDVEPMRQVAIHSYVTTFAEFNTPENMQAFLEEAYNIDQLKKEFYEPGSALLLAFNAERIIGFARLRENKEAESYLGKNTLELQRLYIDPDFQNQKVGKILMQHSLDYARAKEKEWMWLGVWERNFKAQRFYANWGFEKFSEHVFYMGDDPQIDWLLKKKLAEE